MNKIALTIVTLGLVVFMGVIFMGGEGSSDGQNVEIKDGVQYIRVNARGGYSPKVTTAKAGIPTKLIMQTSGTFDCSASLVIHSLNFQKILPQNGETEIDLGTPKVGEPLSGVCGMGMYGFKINFEN
ncbi:MAG: cupredoxin domain-containing protein [Candidatus Paceibacterota bacterium]|jgi:plastocyanin domain-containing protein